MFKIIAFFIIRLISRLNVRVLSFTHTWTAFAQPHHFNEKGRVGPIKLVKKPSRLFIEVPVTSKEDERSCIFILRVSICISHIKINN